VLWLLHFVLPATLPLADQPEASGTNGSVNVDERSFHGRDIETRTVLDLRENPLSGRRASEHPGRRISKSVPFHRGPHVVKLTSPFFDPYLGYSSGRMKSSVPFRPSTGGTAADSSLEERNEWYPQ